MSSVESRHNVSLGQPRQYDTWNLSKIPFNGYPLPSVGRLYLISSVNRVVLSYGFHELISLASGANAGGKVPLRLARSKP